MQNTINEQKSEKKQESKNTFSVSVKKKASNDQRRALGALVK